MKIITYRSWSRFAYPFFIVRALCRGTEEWLWYRAHYVNGSGPAVPKDSWWQHVKREFTL